MSAVDSSWSEPQGIPVVTPGSLATGTARHPTFPPVEVGDDEHDPLAPPPRAPPTFLGMPIEPPPGVARPAAATGRVPVNNDATSFVDPLPRPRALDPHEPPRAPVIPDAQTARARHRRIRRRRSIAILAGAGAGLAAAAAAALLVLAAPARDGELASPP